MRCLRAVRLLAAVVLMLAAIGYPTFACCPAPPPGELVVNADQTVIMIWDPAAKRQHFIRQASFKSEGKDFGFLIPSPSQPELGETGNEAFERLLEITEPKVVVRSHGIGGCQIGCSKPMDVKSAAAVRVLEEKQVAGYQASVLEADNAEVLLDWLKEHGYAYSDAVADWAKPYVEQNWKITALKVSPEKVPAHGADRIPPSDIVKAKALRLSFDTERPLFPYREPNYEQLAKDDPAWQNDLKAAQRLLRIYFLSNAKYEGELTKEQPWTGKVAWSGKLAPDQRTLLLEKLTLPAETGPAEFYLTEFEDVWPYRVAPADVYFAAAGNQDEVRRPDVYAYADAGGDPSLVLLMALAFVPLLIRRKRA